MKKNYPPRTFTAVMMLVASVSAAWAAPRSIEQARQIALEQMTKNRAAYSKGNGKTSVLEPELVYAKDKAVGNVHYYYVFSAGKGLGYTIVSGDDRMPDVVGYTDSGDYDADSLPSNFVSFMQAYQDFVDNATDEQVDEVMEMKAQTTGRSSVMPLMGEKWNQSSPYNNMCPTYQGQSTYTGCVATAVAQILHYHYSKGADIRLKNTIPAYTTKELGIYMPDIAVGQTYDWANMQYIYNGDETAVQNDAVAKLMLHVGCAVQMDYTPDASGANATAGTFVDYFGMDPDLIRNVNRSIYNIQEWDNILYEEMVNHRPVLYSGASMNGAHAFVIHGYADGLYYVNWGWGGSCDGYFDVTVLNPHSSSGAGASSSDDGYSMQNRMIVGIQPDNGKVDDTGGPVINSYLDLLFSPFIDVSTKKVTGKVMLSPQNQSLVGKINVSVGYKDNDNNIINVGVKPFELNSEIFSVGFYYNKNIPVDISFNYEDNRIYQLLLIESRDNENWTICNGAEKTSVMFKVENGKVVFVNPKTELSSSASLSNTSGGYAGMSNTIDITVSNAGDKEYYDKVYIMVGNSTAMPAGYTFAQGVTAPAGGSTTFSFYYTPETAGAYNFWILDADGCEIGKSSITFKTAAAPVLSFVSIKCANASGDNVYAPYGGYEKVEMNKVNDTKAEFVFEIKNDGGYYEGDFYVFEYHGKWSGYSQILKIPGYATTKFTFTSEGNVGEVVGIMIENVSEGPSIADLENPYKHKILDNGYVYSAKNYEFCYLAGPSSGIDSVVSDSLDGSDSQVIYNLNGQRMNASRRGINIINGRKVIVK